MRLKKMKQNKKQKAAASASPKTQHKTVHGAQGREAPGSAQARGRGVGRIDKLPILTDLWN